MIRMTAILPVLLCAACAATPRPVKPQKLSPVKPPAHFVATPLSGRYTAKADWWKAFRDPKLDELVSRAIGKSPEIAAARARVEEAAAIARSASASLLPQLTAESTAGHNREFTGALPFFPETIGQDAYGVSLDLSWEADIWGRLGAKESAALAGVKEARDLRAAAELSLAGQTAKAYFAVVAARQQIDLTEKDLTTAEELERLIRARAQRGTAQIPDVRLAENETAVARDRLAKWKEALGAARRQLETLAVRYPAGEVGTAAILPALPRPVPPGIPAQVLSRRPDLAAAAQAVAAARAKLRESRAALYPRFALTTSQGLASDALTDVLTGDFHVWSFAANVAAPLFSGGRLHANVDLARAGEEEADAGFAAKALEAFREVETALDAEGHLKARLAALTEAVRAAREGTTLAMRRYRSGVGDLLVILESRRRAYKAESTVISVRRQLLSNRVDLHLALGGGFGVGGESPLSSGGGQKEMALKAGKKPGRSDP